jgi:hypothetical protein
MLGFEPTYLVCVNRLVLEQSASDLSNVRSPLFVTWQNRRLLRGGNPILLYARPEPMFATDPTQTGIWEGGTVTYVAMQLAYYMGFQRIVLVGVDHNFVTGGEPNREVVSGGDDPNHFHPGYFGKGFRWQLPDLAKSEIAYGMARQAYASAGRSIVDATVRGKLQVFPKATLADALR